MTIDFGPLEKEVSRFLAENAPKKKRPSDDWKYYLDKARKVVNGPMPNDAERRRVRLNLAARWLGRAINTLPK